jgi:ABC-type multidrug transport system ATPase subunit
MKSENHTVLAELKGIRKRYARQAALDCLDSQLRSGELLAVLEPNGAGKSMALTVLVGLAAVCQFPARRLLDHESTGWET